jgi:hypothetical protein
VGGDARDCLRGGRLGEGFGFSWLGFVRNLLGFSYLPIACLVEELATAFLPVRECLLLDQAVSDRGGEDFGDFAWLAIEVGGDFVSGAPAGRERVGFFGKVFPSAHR